jgi:hypothetical protein
MKYKILEITDWEKDVTEEMADSGHISDGDIMRLELEEYEKKIENGEWPGLPFVCEAKSESDAIDKYNEKFCDGDYYRATDADFDM